MRGAFLALLCACAWGQTVAIPGPGMAHSAGVTYANGYSNCKVITVSGTTMVSGSSDLSSFPVLLNFTDADLKVTGSGGSVQSSSGYDIIFDDSTACSGVGTALSWETEKYVSTTGEFVSWLKLATLHHGSDDKVSMYFGKSGVSSFQSTASAVWDTNYKGVWHLPDGSILNVNDSTGNANNGTNVSAAAATGKIDGAASATGTQYITTGSSSTIMPASAFTLSAWVNSGSFASYPGLISAPTQANNAAGYILAIDTTGKLTLYMDTTGNGAVYAVATSAGSMSTSTWYYVVGVWDGATERLYINGAADGTHANSAMVYGTITSPARLLSYPSQNYTGTIDEARISNINRSPDWILTEYRNQSAPGTYITEGPKLP